MFLVQRTWSFPVLCRLRYQSLHSSAVRTISLFTRAQSCAGMSKLEELVFDNRALKNLPVETDTQNYVRTVVGTQRDHIKPCLQAHFERFGNGTGFVELFPHWLNFVFVNGAIDCIYTTWIECIMIYATIGACFSRVRPTPLTNPQLVAHSQSALDLLGLSPDQVITYIIIV